MYIIGISCSPRKSGNTELLVGQALSGAAHEGAQTELITLSGKDIRPCDGCSTCLKTGVCHINDDIQTIHQKFLAADGIIFGTPVYLYSLASQAKALIDRTYALNQRNRNLANKVGGVIAVAGSLGLIDALKDIYFFMIVHRMLPANFVAAYAMEKGEISNYPKTNKAAWELGREMVQLAMKKFEYPSEFRRSHSAYGTHTR
ncbi:flavodoxin family protein [Chloroflexota bacterium]